MIQFHSMTPWPHAHRPRFGEAVNSVGLSKSQLQLEIEAFWHEEPQVKALLLELIALPKDSKWRGQDPARLLHQAFSKDFPEGEPTGAQRVWALRTESAAPEAPPKGSIQTFARFIVNAQANLDTLALSYFRPSNEETMAPSRLPVQIQSRGTRSSDPPPPPPQVSPTSTPASPTSTSLWTGENGQRALRKLLLTFATRPVYRLWDKLDRNTSKILYYLEHVETAELQESGARGVWDPPDAQAVQVLQELVTTKNATVLRQLINAFVRPSVEKLRMAQKTLSDQEFLQWVLSNEQSPQRLRTICPEDLAPREPSGFTKLTALELAALAYKESLNSPRPPTPLNPVSLPAHSPPRGVTFDLNTCTLDSLRALVEEHYPAESPARKILLTILSYERPNQAWLASPLLRLFGDYEGGDEAIVALWEASRHHSDERLRHLIHRLQTEPLDVVLGHPRIAGSQARIVKARNGHELPPPAASSPARPLPQPSFIAPQGHLLSHGKLKHQINKLPYLRAHKEILLTLLEYNQQGALAIQRLVEAFGPPRRDGAQRLSRLIQQANRDPLSTLILIAKHTDQQLIDMTTP